MARLPQSLEAPAPSGARMSTDAPRATDFGLGEAAEALDSYAKQRAALQEKDDDRVALAQVSNLEREFMPGFTERSAAYDGREPGFAAGEIEQMNMRIAGLVERSDLNRGVRERLISRTDQLRANFGQQAVSAEAGRRGQIMADEVRDKRAVALNGQKTDYTVQVAEALKRVRDAYDGSQENLVALGEAAIDEVTQPWLDGAPEEQRGSLAAWASGQKGEHIARLFNAQSEGHLAFVANAAKASQDKLVNAVLSDPDAYGQALARGPELAAGLPAALQDKVRQDFRGALAEARINGLVREGRVSQARAELDSGRYDGVLEPARKKGLQSGIEQEAGQRARSQIDAMRYGGEVDPEDMLASARASNDPGLEARAEYTLEFGAAEPGALSAIGEGATAATGFNSAFRFTYEREGGDVIIENDNGRGVTRGGINQSANPDLDVRNLTPGQQKQRYRRYWREVGADSLPPGLALATFDAAVLHGPGTAKRWLAQSNGDVGSFLALQSDFMRKLAKDNPEKYGDDLKGWLNRVGLVRKEAARLEALQSTQDGLSGDPIKFAMGNSRRAPLAQVPGLPEDLNDQAAVAEALKGRQAVGALMTRNYRTPFRMLTGAEASYWRDQIGRDPAAGVALAEVAIGAVGGAAARSLMAEIGKDTADVTVHIADLAAAGLANYPKWAAQGLSLKAKGEKLDKALVGQIDAEIQDRAGLFAGQPELRMAVRATAEAAALGMTAAGQQPSAWAVVNSAMGASKRNGRVFGGVTKVNGRETIIPTWLATDSVDDAMEWMALGWETSGKGPVYLNGKPVPARVIEQLSPQLMPNGRYRLVDRSGAAMASRTPGQPFEFDFEGWAKGLRNRLGPAAVQDVR